MNIIYPNNQSRNQLLRKTNIFIGGKNYKRNNGSFYHDGVWIDINKYRIEIVSIDYDKKKHDFLKNYIQYLFPQKTIGVFAKGDQEYPFDNVPGVKIMRSQYG